MAYLWWNGTKRWLGAPIPPPIVSPDALNWTYNETLNRWELQIGSTVIAIADENGIGAS